MQLQARPSLISSFPNSVSFRPAPKDIRTYHDIPLHIWSLGKDSMMGFPIFSLSLSFLSGYIMLYSRRHHPKLGMIDISPSSLPFSGLATTDESEAPRGMLITVLHVVSCKTHRTGQISPQSSAQRSTSRLSAIPLNQETDGGWIRSALLPLLFSEQNCSSKSDHCSTMERI